MSKDRLKVKSNTVFTQIYQPLTHMPRISNNITLFLRFYPSSQNRNRVPNPQLLLTISLAQNVKKPSHVSVTSSEYQPCFTPPFHSILMLTSILSVHIKSHTLPFKCPKPSCKSLGFRYKKDRDRHIADMHPELVPDAERYFCPMEGCKHSRAKGKGFPRKDNCERHVKNCKLRNR